MPLIHLLYRCPACGQDPVEGHGERMGCPACGARFERERETGRVAVHGTERWSGAVDVGVLVDRIAELGGPFPAARRPGGGILQRSGPAHLSVSPGERPVRRGGTLVGFAEMPGEERPGTLEATGDELRFTPAGAGGPGPAGGATTLRHRLVDLAALQVATMSLKLRLANHTLFQVRLEVDSLFRWETLLQGLIREAWSAAGRGEVVEFQPRIVAGHGP